MLGINEDSLIFQDPSNIEKKFWASGKVRLDYAETTVIRFSK